MVEIAVLGPVAVRRADRAVHLGGTRQRALLVRLLIARGHSVPTGVLVDDLWCEPAAGDALKTSVSRLRRVLGAEAITHDGTGYALQVGSDHIDTTCFEAGVAAARLQRPGDAGKAAARYGRALDLWRGRALADVEGLPWAQPEASRLEELRLVAIEERFEALIAAGAASEVVADLAATVREYPWREQLTSHLMRALYRSGRQREALEAFEHLATALREELGLEPSRAVRELERSILRQDTELDAPTRDRVIAYSGAEADTPANRFVGRIAELEALEAAVHRSRVVAIVGPGGTGKSRLIDQLLANLGDRYRDGTCNVSLGTVRAPALVADHIATRLGLVDSAETGPVEPAELLAAYLRDREMLLVLDGCEAVLGVVRTLVSHVIAECPGIRVVATTRAPLAIGEATITLGPLATPRAGAAEAEIATSDAVQLFLERRDHVAPHESAADLAAIGELTRVLGGSPLAIELVASLSGTTTPAVILDRARELLGVSSTRTASLDTTFALSHEGLSEPERVLFRRAGVFAAGFDISALEAVAVGDGLEAFEIAGALHALESSALVYPMGHARNRRRMLDTVREDALDRLRDAGELELMLTRQAAHYVQLAERADLELRGPAQDAARDRLDMELDNLRDVLDRLLTAGENETAARLTAALTDYWYLRGHWAEGRRWVERAMNAMVGSRSLARSRLLRSHANRGGFSEIHDRMAELEEALEIARELDAREDEIWLLLFMAGAFASTGDHARMAALVADADWLIAQLDDPWIRAVRRSYIAATDTTIDPVEAHALQLCAHDELLALGDRAWAGRCLWFAGSIARRRHDLATAERELTRAIELSEAAGDRAATAHARASLARTAFERCAPEWRALFERCIEELASIGDSHCANILRAAMGAAVTAG